jgi:hypothetical protein
VGGEALGVSKRTEPRKRVQVVTPRRRVVKSRSRKTSSINVAELLRSATSLAKPAAALLALILLIVGYNAMADSSLFDLRRVDVSGVSSDLQPAVRQVVLSTVNQSRLLSINLATIKRRIEDLPRVREASVARLLPDGLYIHTVEREPAVLVRRQSQSMVWLDQDAVEVGELDVKHESDVPPILKGFAEGNRSPAAVSEDKERIDLFKKIEREFKQSDKLWDLIDEIDLSLPRRVSIRLKSLLVNIVVGGEDFRNRFERALKILGAAKQGDSGSLGRFGVQDPEQMIQNRDRITFMDTSRPDRIVYSFSSTSKEKTQEAPMRRQEDSAASRKPTRAPSRPSATETEQSRPRRIKN